MDRIGCGVERVVGAPDEEAAHCVLLLLWHDAHCSQLILGGRIRKNVETCEEDGGWKEKRFSAAERNCDFCAAQYILAFISVVPVQKTSKGWWGRRTSLHTEKRSLPQKWTSSPQSRGSL